MVLICLMRKLFVFFSVVFLFLFLTLPVIAQENSSRILSKEQIVNGDYFAAGSDIRLFGTVNGDAYVTGGDVLVDGTVNGDLLVAGGTVTIRGAVQEDIRVVGGSVTIAPSELGGSVSVAAGEVRITEPAVIGENLAAAAGSLIISAPVENNINAAAGKITIAERVGGNVMTSVESLSLSPQASISGNLTYWSDNDAEISPDASVSGNVKRNDPVTTGFYGAAEGADAALKAIAVGFKIADFIVSFIIGLLFIYLFPIATKKVTENISAKPLISSLVGLAALILIPIVAFLFALTLFGIPLSILIFFLYLILLYTSRIYFAVFLGQKIFQSVRQGAPADFWILLVGLFAYFVLTLIPILGTIIQMIVVIVSFGALLITDFEYYKILRERKIL